MSLSATLEQNNNAENTASSAFSLTIERSLLLKALGHVQSVVEKRNTIPILSNVKLVAENNQLALTATDMDIAITEKIAANVSEAGALTVPAHTFYDIIRKLPDGSQIELSGDSDDTGRLNILAPNCKFALPCLPVAEFPVMDAGSLPNQFEVTPAELIALIDKTRFAISTEETRYYLNGIYLHATEFDGNTVLKAVATDGHRLGCIQVDAPAGAESIPGVIVPRKTVIEVRKLLDGVEDNVKVALSENKISFTIGDDAILLSKLIDGTFPDYEKVIPQYNKNMMKVDRNTLAQAVDRVSTISSERSRAVKITLSNNLLTLSANNEDSGTAKEEIAVDYDGKDIEIGFNSRYLLEILSGLEDSNAEFAFADGAAPAVVKDPATEGALFVIMPMRI